MENRQKEWMVKVWGGAWNDDADPSIEKDLGIKEGTYYFIDEKAKDKFCQTLRNPDYEKQGIAMNVEYDYMTHKRTIFVGTFKYQDKEFILHHDFGYEYPEDVAFYCFTEGNYSCDCNLSLFIQDEYGKDAIPELDCGDEIELLDCHFEYLD